MSDGKLNPQERKALLLERFNVEEDCDDVYERTGQAFEESGVATLPWLAFELAFECGDPIPEWVLTYFYNTAKQILKSGDKGREAEAVGKILGFGKRGRGETPILKENINNGRDLAIAIEVTLEENKGTKKDAAVFEIGKKYGVKDGTVYDALKEYGEEAKKILKMPGQPKSGQ